MKKIGAVALTALLVGSVWTPFAVQAKEDVMQLKNEEVKDASDYVRAPGVITKIEDIENERMVTVENDQGLITIFRIQNKTLLFNSGTANDMKPADLKKDMKVEAYYDKNKPMILIYPAQITPELFIVIDEANSGNVKVGKFDEDFLSVDKELKLNIGEETKIVNQAGDKIKKVDLKGKELVVFYSNTTRSLPPQTPPTKIIVLHPLSDGGTTEVLNAVLTIIDNDHYMKDGVKMIPLRKVAEELGYYVISQSKINGALLTKGNVTFTITRGEKIYGYNKSLQQFAIEPELIGGNKTYVSEDILELLGNQ